MHPAKIRILHVQAVDAIGGTERTNFTVLTGMDRARFENELCILAAEGPYRAAYEAAGIPVHYLHGNPFRLAALLRRNRYDMILLYGLRANLLGRVLAPFFSGAVRVEVKHGVDNSRGRFARTLDRATAGLVDQFVSNSYAGARMLAELERKPRDRLTVIHNGIDARQFKLAASGPPAGVLRLIAVANLLPCKGHKHLIQGLELLQQEGVDCELLLAGDGSERAHLEALAEQVAPGRVRFLGRRSDIPQLLAAADILLQPSLSEGLPNSIMEAMAAGLPVIATDVGGNGELVSHGETGLLVPPGSAHALAGAVRLLAAGAGRRKQMGAAGRRRIRSHFPLEKMVSGFERFCLEHGRRTRPDVLFFTTTGMAVHYLIRRKIEGLIAAGYDVRVLCGDDAYVPALKQEGFHLDAMPVSRFAKPWADLLALIRLVRYLRRERPRAIHTCTPKAGLLGPVAARLAGIPAAHSVFGLLFHDRASRLRNLVFKGAERLTALCAGDLLFQSREDLARIRALQWKPERRLFYLGNGVDVERFSPEHHRPARRAIRARLGYGDDDFVVGLVARLLLSKGLGEFLAAAGKLRPLPDIRFLVIGPAEKNHPGAVPDELIRQAEQAGNVQFAGERHDMPELYAAMDLFALPSYREGVPRALLEASVMELPVIATDIRGCREVVLPGRTGWLMPVRDPDALAQRILDCRALPDRGRNMGRAGREYICREFDERAVNERLLRFYRELLGEPGGRATVARPTELVTQP